MSNLTVISGHGVPVAAQFHSSFGTPIYIDLDSAKAYYCTAAGVVTQLSGGGGSPGPAGSIGFPGFDGLDGEDGTPGWPGSVGSTGLTGSIGLIGPMGLDGPQGDQGDEGFAIPGPVGSQGAIGVTGASGAQPDDLLALLNYAFQRIKFLEQIAGLDAIPSDIWVPEQVALLDDNVQIIGG